MALFQIRFGHCSTARWQRVPGFADLRGQVPAVRAHREREADARMGPKPTLERTCNYFNVSIAVSKVTDAIPTIGPLY